MPVTADLGFVPDTFTPDLGFVPDRAAPQTDLGFVPDKYPGGLTEAEWQHVLTLVPRPAKPLPDDQLGADIQRENARQAALDQPFAAVGPGGKIFQETPQYDPEANTAEFAKLWQVPGDVASAVAADSVAQGTTPITQSLYGKNSTPPWLPINTVVALENAFRNTAANPNPQPLPIDTDYAQLSQQHPVLATTAKISRGVTASAPLLAVGGAPAWAGRLMALGFSAQMIASAGPAAQTLGTELGKNPEDRDNDKISSAIADLVQDFGFAPFAGLHGARDIVEGYGDKPMDAIRQLSEQLQNAPIVGPAATGDQGGITEANASDVLPSQATETPKVENLAAAVQDLQDTLRGKLPAQEQQTVNAPSDRADEIIRNVFPGETQPIVDAALNQRPNYDDANTTVPESHAVEVTDERTGLVREVRIAKDTKAIATAARKLTMPIGDLRAAGMKDAHHVIQDAAVRDLPGYDSNLAPGVQLPGPARVRGTRHNIATSVQRQVGGGTYAAERRIGYKALRQSGYSEQEAKQIIKEADAYFGSIGVRLTTPTRIPANRKRRLQ